MLKRFWVLMIGLVLGITAMAQQQADLEGKWYGTYKLYYGERQRIILNFEKEAGEYKGTLTLPDLPVAERFNFTVIIQRGDTLLFRIDEIRFAYAGVWDPATRQFKGNASFGPDMSAVNFGRKEIEKGDINKRPQEPKPPFSYLTEEVQFTNTKEKVTLGGTFTRPRQFGLYPVVILLGGSGAQTRDDEMAGHKLFLVLADYFAKNGIATLRYDDRGVGASSGQFDTATIYNFANDAQAAVDYLNTRRDVYKQKIGVLGHSEGAIIAQLVAANNPSIAFVISMAGIGLPGRELVDLQTRIKNKLEGVPDSLANAQVQRMKPYWDLLAGDQPVSVVRPLAEAMIHKLYDESPAEIKQSTTAEEMVKGANITPEAISVLRYKPLEQLKKIKCPFMAINGTNDVQVDATANLNAIERILRENGNGFTTVRQFQGLNHLFQRCITCEPDEYGELEQTIDPLVPEFMAHWILQLPPWSGPKI